MNILVISHAEDGFMRGGHYLLEPVLRELRGRGHDIAFCRGTTIPDLAVDIAIMHVDLTAVPDSYVTFGQRFSNCLNLRATDISKRKVSGAIVGSDDDWPGPVIVKSNLNCGAIRELRLQNLTQERRGGTALPPRHFRRIGYEIFETIADVPAVAFHHPATVVEKFIPERIGDLFAIRFWTFVGDQERCVRVHSREPIIKASNQIGYDYCEVPEDLRQRRHELGFDFGKFDFAMHDGKAVLFDANKTPGRPPVAEGLKWPSDFADGVLRFAD
ncbi:MAG TPA: hypothetical protein VJ859_13560 [Allosphingosinicella sp.]|nr:hypothetical protein [Allosphingosinicella sp.]